MTTTTDTAEFERKWNDHIDELEKLKHSLPPEKFDELDQHTWELKELVQDAKEYVGDDE